MTTSTHLPLPGQISRKRRRHWRRQIIKLHPGINPPWLDARYELVWMTNGQIPTNPKPICRFDSLAKTSSPADK